jgi:transposase
MTTLQSTRQPRPRVSPDLATPVRAMVWLGVDTHQRTHHAAVCDAAGGVLGQREFPASSMGYDELIAWAESHGQIAAAGVESTSSYGAALTRRLLAHPITVREVNAPDLGVRAAHGKSDALDAVMAARAVINGRAIVVPKETTGVIESIRVLKVARDSAVKARTAAYGQLRDLATTAPDDLREQLLPLTGPQRVKACRALRPRLIGATAETLAAQAAKHALKSIAMRINDLDEEITDLDRALTPLVTATAPRLLALNQIGVHTAAQLLITAGQNIDRITNEAAFARLCGVAPIPASSGKTTRMRLHRGGDRQANRALYLIAVGRLRSDPRSRAYRDRRTTEGLDTKDIIRCLKRYAAREAWNALKTDLSTT